MGTKDGMQTNHHHKQIWRSQQDVQPFRWSRNTCRALLPRFNGSVKDGGIELPGESLAGFQAGNIAVTHVHHLVLHTSCLLRERQGRHKSAL